MPERSLRVNLVAHGSNIEGQGVGSAFKELAWLLQDHASAELDIRRNSRRGADINHFSTIDPLSWFYLRTSRAPSVMHVHFLPTTIDQIVRLPRPLLRVFRAYVTQFYRAADQLVVVNPTAIPGLVELDIDPARITYIPNHVSDLNFHPVDKSSLGDLYAGLGFDPGVFTVLGVGQVHVGKGILDFVEVARSLPDLQFVWCGRFALGRFADSYDQLRQAMEEPPPNVRFTGLIPRTELNRWYNLADVLFSPSYDEGFPMSMLEACNVGLPLLVRELDLYQPILGDHYLSAKDNHGFSAALRGLAADPAAGEHWAAESALIARQYSADVLSRRWIDFYHRVLKAPGSPRSRAWNGPGRHS